MVRDVVDACRSRCRGTRARGRPAPGRWPAPPGWNSALRDQQRRDEAGGDQEDAHDHRGRGEQPLGAADPARRALPRCRRRRPRTCGITATPVSKPDRPERQLGEDQQGDADHHQRVAVLRRSARSSSRRPRAGGWRSCHRPTADHDDVEREVDRRPAPTAMPIASVKPAQEDRAEQRQQDQGDRHLVAVQDGRQRAGSRRGGRWRRRPTGSS